MTRPHPFRDWGVWEFDDEHPEGWPVCADCGERRQGHVGFISLGAVHTGERGRFLDIAEKAERLARDAKLDPDMCPDPAEGFRWAAQAIRDAVGEAWPK